MGWPMGQPNDVFFTRDPALAAAIWCAGHETEVKAQRGTAWFHFSSNAHVRETAALFRRGRLLLDARKFSVALRRLELAAAEEIEASENTLYAPT